MEYEGKGFRGYSTLSNSRPPQSNESHGISQKEGGDLETSGIYGDYKGIRIAVGFMVRSNHKQLRQGSAGKTGATSRNELC